MYKGILLKNLNSETVKKLRISEADITEYKEERRRSFNSLKDFYLENLSGVSSDIFDTDLILDKLFPIIENAEVFISHSHADENLAIALACYLKENFNLNVFIDSCVWAYSGHLLYAIADAHCRPTKNSSFFEYGYTIQAASHVNMMLNASLHKMINKAELFLFIDTDNSVNLRDLVLDKDKTFSPWIFSELFVSSIIKPKEPDWIKAQEKVAFESLNEAFASRGDVKFAHGVYKEHLLEILFDGFLEKSEEITNESFCRRVGSMLPGNSGKSIEELKNLDKINFLKWIYKI